MTARIDIAYDGRRFHGWARQPELRTVQGVLETALARLHGGREVGLTVAGRTDTGVHAWGQVASYEGEPVELRAVNALLPPDIAVRASAPAPEGFDARRDARSRTYCFRVLNTPVKDPFQHGRVLWWPRRIDREALHECAALVPGRHDFTAFTPTLTEHVHFHREVLRCEWREHGDLLELWIEADAFMRHMNRILVGTMLQVAGGRRSAASFAELLGGAHRRDAGPTAEPHGLYFASVSYD